MCALLNKTVNARTQRKQIQNLEHEVEILRSKMKNINDPKRYIHYEKQIADLLIEIDDLELELEFILQ